MSTQMYNPSMSYVLNFKLLAIFCGCTVQFVSDLVIKFSHNAAHIVYQKSFIKKDPPLILDVIE